MNKICTNIPQSKKFVELGIDVYTADMCYPRDAFSNNYDEEPVCHCSGNIGIALPAWSLTALLSILQDYTLQTNTDGTVFVVCESKKPMISNTYNNPVDACYEMVIKLHELKML